MIFAILVGFILFFIGWLLFMPIVLQVNTDRGVYEVFQWGTVRFWLADGQPRLKVFNIPAPLDFAQQEGRPEKKLHKKRTGTIKPNTWHNVLALLKDIIHSITVRWFQLDIDTDDVALNAKLVPVFVFFSRGPVKLATNFQGRLFATLRVEVKLYKIGWALLLFFTKKQNVWK